MPAVSKKQERFMQAVAHNPAFAKKAGVPQSVGKEFTKPKGTTMPISLKKKTQSEELDEKKKEAISDSMGMRKGGMAMKKYAKGGFVAPSKMGGVKTAAPSRDGIASKGKTKGTMIKMAGNSNDLKAGGMPKKMNKGGRAC
jgi:hypothetical protein